MMFKKIHLLLLIFLAISGSGIAEDFQPVAMLSTPAEEAFGVAEKDGIVFAATGVGNLHVFDARAITV